LSKRLNRPTHKAQSKKVAIPATSTIGPPVTAEATSWVAASATAMGIYMVAQNSVPSTMPDDSALLRCSHARAIKSRIMAKPTPPRLALTCRMSPRKSPIPTPISEQIAISATP
jgi:hypothetical protein